MGSLSNSFIDNNQIQSIYLENEHLESDSWKLQLFNRLQFLVRSRVEKNKKFLPKDDLSQELQLQLWLAIKSFDCHKNFDFYRWASWHLSKGIRAAAKQKTSSNSINLFVQSTLEHVGYRQEMMILLKQILENKSLLSDRERHIIVAYFAEGKTLAEIGKDLHLTPERVRQVRDIALSKIRELS
jgi:RNA polymerase sigma factor (sigma-70 family)